MSTLAVTTKTGNEKENEDRPLLPLLRKGFEERLAQGVGKRLANMSKVVNAVPCSRKIVGRVFGTEYQQVEPSDPVTVPPVEEKGLGKRLANMSEEEDTAKQRRLDNKPAPTSGTPQSSFKYQEVKSSDPVTVSPAGTCKENPIDLTLDSEEENKHSISFICS